MKRLSLYAALLGLTQCAKGKPDAAPADKLPPATQTGAGTFGCLVNGQPWTPKGSNGRENFRVAYDPGYNGGSLEARAYRLVAGNSATQSIIFGGGHISQPGTYPFVLVGERTAFYTDGSQAAPCSDFGDPPQLTYRRGSLTVTRLDLQAGVVSGTFEFTLARPGCDTLRVTQGRFDKKL